MQISKIKINYEAVEDKPFKVSNSCILKQEPKYGYGIYSTVMSKDAFVEAFEKYIGYKQKKVFKPWHRRN